MISSVLLLQGAEYEQGCTEALQCSEIRNAVDVYESLERALSMPAGLGIGALTALERRTADIAHGLLNRPRELTTVEQAEAIVLEAFSLYLHAVAARDRS